MEKLKEYRSLPLTQRREEARRQKAKQPTCIPAFIDRINVHDPETKTHKFLLRLDDSLAEVWNKIRNKTLGSDAISAYQSVILFVGLDHKRTIVPMSQTVRQLYQDYHADDNILYLTYTVENTLG